MIEYISKNKELVFSTEEIAQNNGAIEENISIDNYNANNKYYLELKCPQDNAFVSKAFVFDNNVGKVVLSNYILQNVGKIFIQLIVRDLSGNLVEKSLLTKQPRFLVSASINASQVLGGEKYRDFCSDLLKSNVDVKNELVLMKEEIAKTNLEVKNKASNADVNLMKDDIQAKLNLLDKKAQIDKLFLGSTKEITINNYKDYDFYLFSIAFGDNQSTIIFNKNLTYEKELSVLSMGTDESIINGAVIVRQDNIFKLSKIGYYQNNIWNNASWYHISAVYGVKINRGE